MLNAIVGFAGLEATLATLERGLPLALANKESLVCAGGLVSAVARAAGVDILPVDSEHSALFQLLAGVERAEVSSLVITASGGPFRGLSRAQLAEVTPAEALAHPTWNMGPKITIDSATLMNKGLEVIEAHHLFSCPTTASKWWCIRNRSCTLWCGSGTALCWPTWGCRTCAYPSPTLCTTRHARR